MLALRPRESAITPINRLFDDFMFGRPWEMPLATRTLGNLPRYTIDHEDDKLSCSIDLPGVSHKDMEVLIDDEGVLIKGKRADTEFSYRFMVGNTYDPETVKARMKNGVLTLTVDPIVKPEPKKVRIETK